MIFKFYFNKVILKKILGDKRSSSHNPGFMYEYVLIKYLYRSITMVQPYWYMEI